MTDGLREIVVWLPWVVGGIGFAAAGGTWCAFRRIPDWAVVPRRAVAKVSVDRAATYHPVPWWRVVRAALAQDSYSSVLLRAVRMIWLVTVAVLVFIATAGVPLPGDPSLRPAAVAGQAYMVGLIR